MNYQLSIVIPCYNEQEIIQFTLDTLLEKMNEYGFKHYEIIVVDDGSKDNSLSIIEKNALANPHIKIISFAANRGQQIAFYAGMCYSSGDAVILMDADLQDPPECIPKMYDLWKKGYHVVYGKRLERKGESFLKKMTAYLFYRMLNHLSYAYIPKDVGEFRLMDRAVVDVIVNIDEKNRFNRALVSWLGFKQIEFVFERPERIAGETKFGWKDMFKLAKDALFSFSYAPIQFIQIIGIFSIFSSILLIIYAVFSRLSNNYSAGWTSLIILITFLFGTTLTSLGIIGEYIIRIYSEIIDRPLFIAAKTINLKNKTLPLHISKFLSHKNNNLN